MTGQEGIVKWVFEIIVTLVFAVLVAIMLHFRL